MARDRDSIRGSYTVSSAPPERTGSRKVKPGSKYSVQGKETSRRGLIRAITKQCGAEALVEAKSHTKVVIDGKVETEIPRRESINKNTGRGIVKRLMNVGVTILGGG